MARTRFELPADAISFLKKKGVTIEGKMITLNKRNNIGLKGLSAIDYLCNQLNYIWRNGETNNV